MAADWSGLPYHITSEIAQHLKLGRSTMADVVRFAAVCKSWYKFAKEEQNILPPYPLPWLMIASVGSCTDDQEGEHCNHGTCIVLDRTPNLSFSISLPKASERRCIGSTGSWIITIDLRSVIRLQNAFNKTVIELPPLSSVRELYGIYEHYYTPQQIRDLFAKKAFVVGLPSSFSGRRDGGFTVMVICGPSDELAIAKTAGNSNSTTAANTGDSGTWTLLEPNGLYCSDVIVFRGKCWAVDAAGMLVRFDVTNPIAPFITRSEPLRYEAEDRPSSRYLVEWCGELLQVLRFKEVQHRRDISSFDYRTTLFKVYRADFTAMKWVEVKHLGRYSLFVGNNTSTCLLIVSKISLRPNCIYFTDKRHPQPRRWFTEGRSHDMGVYSLEDAIIEPYFPTSISCRPSPMLWIVPDSSYM